jgi:hypothetical protein
VVGAEQGRMFVSNQYGIGGSFTAVETGAKYYGELGLAVAINDDCSVFLYTRIANGDPEIRMAVRNATDKTLGTLNFQTLPYRSRDYVDKIYCDSTCNTIYMVSSSGWTLYRSRDRGQTWSAIDYGEHPRSSIIGGFCADESGETLLVGLYYNDVFGSKEYRYLSIDSGASWQKVLPDQSSQNWRACQISRDGQVIVTGKKITPHVLQ